ncbi:hypothetical protein FZEAL_7505 [Fusarium zealandicum]|uniref:Isopropylmalate dehydrogenase-like domain-containing protein n=1 Tax=Fusarium zealandicum TaxID=1053134 RepID=A0A8H4UFK4_9HYPO|nr:hypothetical protein FZEAL_7505 [Fusarium zealandicum]
MFQGFESFAIQTQDADITIHGLKSGDASSSKPPLLLLHGFPQTLHIWHLVAPKLLERYTIILIDIRGYGQSSKPEHVAAYAKSAMARDCVDVMDGLGFDGSFYVCAHDRGARVAHKLCVDYPDRVRKAILLDICPTLAMYTKTDFDFARAYFHWFFLIQQEPLPETLISARPREFAEFFMGGRQKRGLEMFDPSCFDIYAGSLEDPAAVHAMCHDYRASATLDLDEARADLENGRLVRCPLLVLWGKHGVIEQSFDAVKEWQDVTESDVTVEGYSVDSGHYVPEHAPQEVVSAILEFMKLRSRSSTCRLIPSPLAGRKGGDIDFWIVRENTKGECSSVGGVMLEGMERETVIQETIMTRVGVDRVLVLRYAFELAQSRPRKKLTSATKSNDISITMPYWDARMMLSHFGFREAAEAIMTTIKRVLARSNVDVMTADMGGWEYIQSLGEAIDQGGVTPARQKL